MKKRSHKHQRDASVPRGVRRVTSVYHGQVPVQVLQRLYNLRREHSKMRRTKYEMCKKDQLYCIVVTCISMKWMIITIMIHLVTFRLFFSHNYNIV